MSVTLSIIIPCYNEARHITRCLSSLLDNDIERDQLEILVVDGMSDDGTRSIVKEFSAIHSFVRLIDNPARIKPIALNSGIKTAVGQYIMRVDAHSTYEPGYVDLLLAEIQRGEVQNVGGVQIPDVSGRGFWGSAIAIAVSHPLAMGNAVHRLSIVSEPRLVDTVYCGCYPKSVFEKIGLFNEKLIRTQDREFNQRLLGSGGKILLLPNVRAHYQPRTSIRAYASWIYDGAKWLFKARHYTDVSMTRIRNFVPFAFVVYLALVIVSGFFVLPDTAAIALTIPLVVYVFLLLVEGARLALSTSNLLLMVSFPLVVVVTHIAYGLGAGAGLVAKADD